MYNGCFVNMYKPSNVDTEYWDEGVIVKLTKDNEP